MAGPLKGFRVLDLSRILAGPWACQLMADYGADVIKVERPGTGDDTRAWGPPFLEAAEGRPQSAYFLAANRGKRSLTLDISTEDGQKIIRELAATSDVFVENYKTGDMARYGLDYESLSAINSRLVYCSITGFGQTGPYSQRPGYDFVIQGMGGLMSVTGEAEEDAGRPMKCGVPVSDLMTAMYAISGILAALIERQTSGRGQYIDMSLLDVQIAWLANQASNYLVSGESPGRMGNAHPNLAPYQTFRASDGDVIIAVGNDRQFVALCQVLGANDLASAAHFASNKGRLAHRRELVEAIERLTAARSKGWLLSTLTAAGVPVGPVLSIKEALDDPQVKARGLVRSMADTRGARVPFVGNPVKFSRSRLEYERAPPILGEHTAEILSRSLDRGDSEIAALRASGSI
ncbi:CaiB/BaiF CoA transferase family protein [Piscinibacter sp.]|uniref:CaiB/BaiF CoA transferase family protein n=1 Tax=Piscinibacter sp. TaxID=1903157 RepID=UPI0035AE22B1